MEIQTCISSVYHALDGKTRAHQNNTITLYAAYATGRRMLCFTIFNIKYIIMHALGTQLTNIINVQMCVRPAVWYKRIKIIFDGAYGIKNSDLASTFSEKLKSTFVHSLVCIQKRISVICCTPF